MRHHRPVAWFVAFLFALVVSLHPWVGQASDPIPTLLNQGRREYEAGRLPQARTLLQQAQKQAQAAGDQLSLAVAWSNLALIDGDQGDWGSANQAIATSLQVLQKVPQSSTQRTVLAQVLNVQGRLQLAQGKAPLALQTWRQTASLYRQLGNPTGEIQSQLRQVRALQAAGLYGQAYATILEPLQKRLQQQPDSPTKVWGLRAVGEGMGVVGNLTEAQKVTQESLVVAQRLKAPQEVAASQMALANLLYARIREQRSNGPLKSQEKEQLKPDLERAIALYTAVAAAPSANQLRAALNHLALLVESDRPQEATALARSLQPPIASLPPDRPGIEARLNFAHSLLRLEASPTQASQVLPLLTTAVEQARQLKDDRLLANALGNLGRAQEQAQQLTQAQATTEWAVLTAKAANASEQLYRWSAQLGRLQEKLGNKPGAIASYTLAVNTLRALRSDLLGVNADIQLVDQETLEPVHRQLVSLLLPQDGSQPDRATLRRTREVVESLQLEEINNYLRAACLQAQVEIDQIEVPQKTAVVYPIILPDRIAIIVSATGQEPRLYTQPIPQTQVVETVYQLQVELRNQISLEFRESAKTVYGWLMREIDPILQQQQVETLVFVLDGAFRNIPMAALYDGEKFLVEKYSIATTLGLRLTQPQPLQAQKLSSVAFGLSEGKQVSLPNGNRKEFSDLPYVEPELASLQKEIQPSTIRLNAQFTRNQFQQTLQAIPAPIVHLATHGQFSSNREQTFLLASDGQIDTDQLARALGAGDASRTTPIELLVLSACETAIGDDRAPLGLAGIALKSGARSTVASLWQVNDNATSLLMQQFYRELATRKVSKAEALQRAQRSILQNPEFRRHPYYWAPFILVGNWL